MSLVFSLVFSFSPPESSLAPRSLPSIPTHALEQCPLQTSLSPTRKPTKIPNIPHCLPQACLSTGWYGKHEGRPRCHMSVSPWGSTGLSPVTESCVSRYMGLDAWWWRRYGRLHTAGAGERRRSCVGLEPRALHTRTDTRLHAGQRPREILGRKRGLGGNERAEERSTLILGTAQHARSSHNHITSYQSRCAALVVTFTHGVYGHTCSSHNQIGFCINPDVQH